MNIRHTKYKAYDLLGREVTCFKYLETDKMCLAHRHVRNPRTTAQQQQRGQLAETIFMWKALANAVNNNYEALPPEASAYIHFRSINKALAASITPEQQTQKAQILTPLIVSEGSLQPIEQRWEGNTFVTDIALGSAEITATTTVADLTLMLLGNNPDRFHQHDELSFIYAEQTTEGVPSCLAHRISIELSMKCTLTLTSCFSPYLPAYSIVNKGGFLGIEFQEIPDKVRIGCCFLQARKRETKARRFSEQHLVVRG